jgi:hypothetical protein
LEFDDPLASRIHNFLINDLELSPDEKLFDMKAVEALHGTFTAYRPFYLNPAEELMIMDLSCGGEFGATGFRLTMRYPLLDETLVTEEVKGSVIPCDGGLMLFGHIKSRRLPVVVSLRVLGVENGRVREAGGAILLCSSHFMPSSYPIFCTRSEHPCTPEVVARSVVEQNSRLWRMIGPTLDRGCVNWQ